MTFSILFESPAFKRVLLIVIFISSIVAGAYAPLVLRSAQIFLSLVVVLSLRGNKISGMMWGMVLGLIFESLMMNYIGMVTLPYIYVGYVSAWLSAHFLISGVIPVALLCAGSYIFTELSTFLLYRLMGLNGSLPAPFDALWAIIVVAVAGGILQFLTLRLHVEKS